MNASCHIPRLNTVVSPRSDQPMQSSTSGLGHEKNRSQNPSLYQIDTRAWLRDLSRNLGRQVTLDDFPDKEIDLLAARGFDWVWFLGVWQTGSAGRKVSSEQPDWQAEFRQVLPDLHQEDISGSPFSITDYIVHSDFGGNPALERLRKRIHQRGIRLLLDFVPNHTALDHPWVQAHPEFYVKGTEEQLRREPENYVRLQTQQDSMIFAYGRDPYFAGWPDTLQLNYAEQAPQEAMRRELLNAATQCDGLRCDMAMLILPEVFERTWGLRPEPFWPNAIQSVRSHKADFLFMAEVYWGLEWTLQQQGFDYTYDKRLYDRLRDGQARLVRGHFQADPEFQRKSARFLENHDEARAAATFTPEIHRAAAALTYLSLGLRFFHDGQFDGRRKKLPVHLGRRPHEPVQYSLQEFYYKLLNCMHRPVARNGHWQLLHCAPAWEANWTWDCFICFFWQMKDEPPLMVVVNYAANQSQCYVRIPLYEFRGHTIRLQDLMGSAIYERNGDELLAKGLYLDVSAWGYHVFELTLLNRIAGDGNSH
jgi:Alpha amylase, catalytic domain